jgi:hypothetical protein
MVKVSLMPALRRRRAAITPRYIAAVPGRRATPAVLALAAAAFCAGPAAAADGPSVYQSKLLWATVNVCDTKASPDTIGIRGSMPGSGVRAERMYMRFQVQFLQKSDGKWHGIGPSGDSGFIPVGSGRFKQRQSGRNFTIPPPRTGSFVLRGAVTFEWREDGEVVRRARKSTTARHGRTAGADPAGYSAASCEIKP